jgi:hypothetical protein
MLLKEPPFVAVPTIYYLTAESAEGAKENQKDVLFI